ncbi:MAG: hypothetical protein JXR25_00940 [Pontiellaceae bacterium]|nr:hypothetical protein [Pontiellaceae bacterium]MBN2783365.1 hypothetical protein [Pontiellaceae bacterium]
MMKNENPIPEINSTDVGYPSFRRFHLNRPAVVAGAALLLAGGCKKATPVRVETLGFIATPEPPAEICPNESSLPEKTTLTPEQHTLLDKPVTPRPKLGKVACPAPPDVSFDEYEIPEISTVTPPTSLPEPMETNRIIRLMGELPSPHLPETE